MNKETLILTPFANALAVLNTALMQPKDEFTRDATILRFEYTYELAWKSLKRYLAEETGSSDASKKFPYQQ